LDLRLAAAASGQLTPQAALTSASVDFEEITVRLGRQAQRSAFRASLGLPR
jgi:multiple sugar transport system substrate-binding protein